MQGCDRCAEMEKRLERAALEHWNAIHQAQASLNPDAIAQMIAETKAAMDEAQALYDEHVASAHLESRTG